MADDGQLESKRFCKRLSIRRCCFVITVARVTKPSEAVQSFIVVLCELRLPMNPDELIDHNLTNHAPNPDSDTIMRFESIRIAAKTLGHIIVDLAPESRERSIALTELELTVMWAVAAIARNQ